MEIRKISHRLESLSYYPIEIRRTLTVKNRQEIYRKLTKLQRELIEKQKKYEIRSFFLENQYLITEDWVFESLVIDELYNQTERKYRLYCQCGKPIKYQFILHSKKMNKTIRLGSTHFSDHLGISTTAAKEIKKRIHHVDLALDEILWLFNHQYQFPDDLWTLFLEVYFYNSQLASPYDVNQKLIRRVNEFRQVDLPIFEADFQSLVTEIKKINQRLEHEKRSFSYDESKMQTFKKQFELQLLEQKKTLQPETANIYSQLMELPLERREVIWKELVAKMSNKSGD